MERCLELWDNDGPTKALQYYMAFYKYHEPAQWNGYRDIDEEIDLEKINMEQNFDGNDMDSGNAEEENNQNSLENPANKKPSKTELNNPTKSQKGDSKKNKK